VSTQFVDQPLAGAHGGRTLSIVLEQSLRAVAVLASLLVIAGWSAFAIDEVRSASQQTQAEIAGGDASGRADPSSRQERAREGIHSGAREALDDADDVVLLPVAFVADGSPSRWVRRSVSALLALLLYGFGAAYLARFARGRAGSPSSAGRPPDPFGGTVGLRRGRSRRA
jgi:hypothetical protein